MSEKIYDVPAEWYRKAQWLGAIPVTTREVLTRLAAANLTRPKHRPH